MRFAIPIVFALAAATFAFAAKSPAPAAPASTRPAIGIVVEDANPREQAALRLEEATIGVTVQAPLAETSITLRLRNTLKRPLEAAVEFPLPEGAAVCGYALDVPAGSGELVDGVIVPKERARQVFESEVRRGIDPGLLEQTRGNNYRVRVHPVPPGGTRTVRVTFVSDMAVTPASATYTLPLVFPTALSKAKLRIEAPGLTEPSALKVEGLPGLAFSASGRGLVAEKSFADVALSGNLTVTQSLPGDAPLAHVESRTKSASIENLLHPDQASPQEHYFLIWATAPAVRTTLKPPARVGIIWDTSLSRANADRTAEYAAVKALFRNLSRRTDVDIFNTAGERLQTFAADQADGCVAFLQSLPCDGALRLDQFFAHLKAAPPANLPDLYLLFSDGLVTLGNATLGEEPAAPVHALCSDPSADHALLTAVAQQAGGTYQDLQRNSPDLAIQGILSPQFVATLTSVAGEVTEVYPRQALIPPHGGVLFAGRMTGPRATAQLAFFSGSGGAPFATREIRLMAGQVKSGPSALVSRFWAQQKAADLALDRVKNADALLALAKEFTLVTPDTSLLVLETVDQYVRYRIVPPKSRPEVYREFMERIEQQEGLAQKEERAKIDHILTLWNARVEWWKTEFKPTKQQLADAARQPAANFGASPPVTGAPSTPAAGEPPRSSSRGLFGDTGNAPAATPAPGRAVARQAALREATDVPAELDKAAGGAGPAASIAIKPWSPDTPYLRALAAATPAERYTTYLAQRKDHFSAPSYYLDCANFFLEEQDRAAGVRILTNIAQLRLEEASLLRVAAYRLLQVGEFDLAIDLFERAKALRPDEPQSWRDLALALAARGDQRLASADTRLAAYDDFKRALELYQHVVMNKWERFDEIELIALMEENALWARIQRSDDAALRRLENALDPRLVKNLDCDVRIVMTWDADNTDIDLHVLEPTGEEAFYSHNRTLSGGLVSRDFTQGYGPEEYLIHHAPAGPYKIRAHYYGSSQQTVQGPVTVQATVITGFGRPDEKRQSLTLRLTDKKESIPIGEITIAPAK